MTESPLEIIRHKEAEMTRRLAAARETAVSEITAVEQQTREMICQAEAEGQREGETQCQLVLDEAGQETELILAQARELAQLLRNVSPAQMDTAVAQAMTIITGIPWPSQEQKT